MDTGIDEELKKKVYFFSDAFIIKEEVERVLKYASTGDKCDIKAILYYLSSNNIEIFKLKGISFDDFRLSEEYKNCFRTKYTIRKNAYQMLQYILDNCVVSFLDSKGNVIDSKIQESLIDKCLSKKQSPHQCTNSELLLALRSEYYRLIQLNYEGTKQLRELENNAFVIGLRIKELSDEINNRKKRIKKIDNLLGDYDNRG